MIFPKMAFSTASLWKTKMKKIISLLLVAALTGCNGTNTKVETISKENVLKENFSETEFKQAIIGKWKSVWKYPKKKNVSYLELNQNGKVKIIIEENGNLQEIKGTYNISFLRTPVKSMITLTKLTITTPEGNIILSRVNFGLHNALPYNSGPFLRIDEEPCGVLEKIMNKNSS